MLEESGGGKVKLLCHGKKLDHRKITDRIAFLLVVTAFYDSTHCQIIPLYVLFSRKVSTRSFRIGIKIDSLFWDKNGLDYDCRFVFYSERIIVER